MFDVGPVAHRLGGPQLPVQPGGVAIAVTQEREGEIHLIAVPGGNIGPDALDPAQVVFPGYGRGEGAAAVGALACPGGQPGIAGGLVQPFALRENPAPQQYAFGRQAPGQLALQYVAQLVVQGQGHPGAVSGGLFQPVEGGAPVVLGTAADFIGTLAEQPGARTGSAGQVGIKEGKHGAGYGGMNCG